MPLKLWVSTDGNFDTTASWSPTGVPATDDTVLFSVDHGGTNQALTAGTDQTAKNFAVVRWDSSFTAATASSGTPFQCTADKLIFRGGGDWFFDEENSGANAETTDMVIIESAFGKKIELQGDTIDKLFVLDGTVALSISNLTELFMVPSSGPTHIGNPRVNMSGTASAFNLFMTGGVYDNRNGSSGGAGTPTNVFMFGGRHEVTSAQAGYTDVYLFGGSYFNLGKTASAVSNREIAGNLVVMGGEFDYSDFAGFVFGMDTGEDIYIGRPGAVRRRTDQTPITEIVPTGDVLFEGRSRVD